MLELLNGAENKSNLISISESKSIVDAYMSRRRNIIPLNYYPKKNNSPRRRRIVRQRIKERVVAQAVEPNHELDMQPVPTDALQLIERFGIQEPTNQGPMQVNRVLEEARVISYQPIDLHEAEQNVILLAKKEKQIEQYQRTIQCLHMRIGPEDLTVERMKEYGEILLSSAEDSNGDSDDDDAQANSANKENIEQIITQNQKQTDTHFSFSHEFVLNVRYLHSRRQ